MALLLPKTTSAEVGNPFHISGVLSSVDGTDQQLFTFTVPVGVTRKLKAFQGTCAWDGLFKVKIGSTLVASRRTGPATRNNTFVWEPAKEMAPGDILTVTFKSAIGIPMNTDVEAFLSALDV